MASTQDDMVAELQRANVALQERLDAALAQRNNESGERIAHQAATIDVLKVMSASPGDPQPVFDLIVQQARALLDVPAVVLYKYDGDQVHLSASDGGSAMFGAAGWEAYKSGWPRTPDRGSLTCRAILDGAIIHIRDMTIEPGVSPVVRNLGHKAQVSIPFMRDGRAIGAISTGSLRVDGIPDTQIELLKTFAEQAVIAISSTETYRALQTRTADLQESLEYQTATSEVLKAISRSTFNLQPVLETLLATAARLCEADLGVISTREGDAYHTRATYNWPALDEFFHGKPIPITRGSLTGRTVLEGQVVHVEDITTDPEYTLNEVIQEGVARTALGVPLLRAGNVIGTINFGRTRVQPFTDRQIELVNTFADQAVIAIENARLLTEQQEALEQQTATAEVLQVINGSPGNLMPVFEAILDKAHNLCGADLGTLVTFDGEHFRAVAIHGFPEQHVEVVSRPFRPNSDHQKLIRGERLVHILDVKMIEIEPDDEVKHSTAERTDVRTLLAVPLRKDGTLLGFISACRLEVRPFRDREITLLENFAAQAVIAMENARLIAEQREALEQQTATAEVLQVINSSPGNLQPVFEAILDKAHRICGAAIGSLFVYDGEFLRAMATHGWPEQFDALMHEPRRPTPLLQGLIRGERLFHIPDLRAMGEQIPRETTRFLIDVVGARTFLALPLRRDRTLLGTITAHRLEVRPFSEKEIALLENFAAQAVIAMENARLLDEIRRHQEELRVTFENMGDGVAMFDETQHLVAWNRKFQDILDVPDDIIARHQTFFEYVRYLAERGEYGHEANPEEHVRILIEQAGQARTYERTRPDGRVIEIRHNPVPSGGFVLIYADITERKRSEAEIRTARDAAEEASRTIEAAYRDLKAAQANLIQAEKMASLGQLTAGIAHEIKNPLNFVNNFSALSAELIDELREVLAPQPLGGSVRAEVNDLTALLKGNFEKVVQHGQRADGIVKAMLEHSRGSSAERRIVDLNTLIDEALNLAYHGARAQDQSFNITLEREFGGGIAPIEVNPQDMTRVFLNLISNGFYAATRRARNGGDAGFMPMLKVTTNDAGEAVEIRVRDNGTGIPADIRDKLFQPFFTTKPTGEGTGLGLSITYDIVTKQHGGTITVNSEVNEFSEFVVTLPRQMFANSDSRA